MSTEQPIRGRTPDHIAPPNVADPTFPYCRSIANMAEATMMRVVELETEAGKLADQSKALTEIAKKLRAAVVANT